MTGGELTGCSRLKGEKRAGRREREKSWVSTQVPLDAYSLYEGYWLPW